MKQRVTVKSGVTDHSREVIRHPFNRRILLVGMVLVASLILSSSVKGMIGKYGNEFMEVEFKSSSKAYVTLMGGATTEVSYDVDGDKIILRNQAGNLVLTVNKDGTLSGAPAGGPMTKRSDSAGSGKPGGSGDEPNGAVQVSGMEREAMDAVMTEIGKHWLKTPEGWLSVMSSGDSYTPEAYYAELRELTVQKVTPFDLSESDKMNGFEWVGEVAFKKAPLREIGEPGNMEESGMLMVQRQRDTWTQWIDYQPEAVRVQKVKGQWRIRTDTLWGRWLLSGIRPPDQVQKTGIK